MAELKDDRSIPAKFWYLLTPVYRRAAVVLVAFMFIGMILETMGIGLLIPALALMTNGDLAQRYPVIASWMNDFGTVSREQLVIAGMLILVVVFTVKALFLAFLSWRQAKFAYDVQSNLSQRMFSGYLRKPYTFHLQHNSAQLIRNAVTETNQFAHSGVAPGLMLMTEILVLVGILVLLLVVEPTGAFLVISTFSIACFGFHRLTKRRLLLWGEKRQLHEGLRLQHLQQGLGGVKDVKLLGREEDFLAQYHLHNVGLASVGRCQATLQQLPRLWLELLAVVGVAVLVIVMIAQGEPLEAIVPTLGLFAAAAFRLMPSANRALGAIQSVRFSLPVIDVLYSELRTLSDAEKLQEVNNSKLPLSFKKELTLDNITFQYPSTSNSALHKISLSIPLGTSVGFVGGSGAGKSTLVDIILGLLTPKSGAVRVDGVDIQTHLRGWQSRIGYVPQSIFLTDDTLRRNVAFGLPDDQIDELAVWRAIRAAQLEQFIRELPRGLDTVVGERGVRLSGGQRQRIGIARALYHDPAVLVLDEATSSLDSVTERGVMEAVKALQGDKTVLIVAHRLSTVEHCERLFRLDRGRVVKEGKMADVLKEIPTTTVAGDFS